MKFILLGGEMSDHIAPPAVSYRESEVVWLTCVQYIMIVMKVQIFL